MALSWCTFRALQSAPGGVWNWYRDPESGISFARIGIDIKLGIGPQLKKPRSNICNNNSLMQNYFFMPNYMDGKHSLLKWCILEILSLHCGIPNLTFLLKNYYCKNLKVRLASKKDLSSVFLGGPGIGGACVTDITSARSVNNTTPLS